MARMNTINNKTQELTIDPGSSGDSMLRMAINDSMRFTLGVDDDDSDKFKISYNTFGGYNDHFEVTTDGEIIKQSTPAFLAQFYSTQYNKTGDSTTYKLEWAADRFDQGLDFDFIYGEFTAPVEGRYRFNVVVICDQLGAANTSGVLKIVTSNRTIQFRSNPGACRNVSTGEYAFAGSVLIDMDAADIAYTTIQVSGGTKIVDIKSNSFFSGSLVC